MFGGLTSSVPIIFLLHIDPLETLIKTYNWFVVLKYGVVCRCWIFYAFCCIYYKAAQYTQVQDTISQRIQFHKVHSVAAGYLPWPSMMSNHPCLLLVAMVIQLECVGLCLLI